MSDLFQILQGDCRDSMQKMESNSVDSIVTDPPYGLSFMGKGWDKGVPSVEFWVEALRVAKPGAMLLVFGGTRMVHRLAVAIEDAGWEIRDRIHWVYGSGFPKSHNISKAIDKCNGEIGRMHKFTEWMRSTGITSKQINDATGTNMGGHYLTTKSQPAIPTPDVWVTVRKLCSSVPDWVDDLVARVEAEREVVGSRLMSKNPGFTGGRYYGDQRRHSVEMTVNKSPGSIQWDGWGTALSPSVEPIIMARKPIEGTIAENALKWGVGGINIDDSRVSQKGETKKNTENDGDGVFGFSGFSHHNDNGRFPSNLVHDGSDEATNGMGEASRYFYCAKASGEDRGFKNSHLTVKPTTLMSYLCRLVTPPGGLILDPFNGSGSTGKAAVLEGFKYVGCELDPDYVAISRERIEDAISGNLFLNGGKT